MKYGPIFLATPGVPGTSRAGVEATGWGPFPHFVVDRHSQTLGMHLSSLLELKKWAPSAGRGKVNNSLWL